MKIQKKDIVLIATLLVASTYLYFALSYFNSIPERRQKKLEEIQAEMPRNNLNLGYELVKIGMDKDNIREIIGIADEKSRGDKVDNLPILETWTYNRNGNKLVIFFDNNELVVEKILNPH